MPHSPREIDVCLLADGIGPGTPGGVSRWAVGLARELPHLRFAMHPSAGELPPARIYHAMTPAAAASAAAEVRASGRPMLLTCHASAVPWTTPLWRGPVSPDSSSGGSGGGGNSGPGNGNGNGWGKGGNPKDHFGGGDPGSGYLGADLIAAVSHAVAETHVDAGAPGDRMIVIPNAVSPSDARRTVREPLVGYVGRLAPVKAFERLLAAVALVRDARPDVRLVAVGPVEGPRGYAEHLHEIAREPMLRGAVSFAGVDRPESWYPRLACLALSSETEGMPLAILEAMAHGVPCVAPDVGGVREAIGEAGIVVPRRDTDALAGAILRLIEDEDEARRLGDLARERSLRWTAADAAAAYEALYRELAPA